MSFQSKDPTTGELLGTYPEHTPSGVEARLQSSWDGWKRWSHTPLSERTAFLLRLANLLEERAGTCARLIPIEMGKPIGEALGEVKKGTFGARHFAEGGAAYIQPETIPGTPGRIVYESLGPIFAVMPWNLPFWQVLRFFIPAALVGNTVVVKHAESVQGCALALKNLVRDAGGPEGLYVNLSVQRDVVPGIIADPHIGAVTVTGSVKAGRSVAQLAGSHGKKVVLELGGSDPFIVLEDASIAKAVQLGVTSRYSNNAQSCIAAKRFLIAEPIFDAFVKAFVEQASALKVGDPLYPTPNSALRLARICVLRPNVRYRPRLQQALACSPAVNPSMAQVISTLRQFWSTCLMMRQSRAKSSLARSHSSSLQNRGRCAIRLADDTESDWPQQSGAAIKPAQMPSRRRLRPERCSSMTLSGQIQERPLAESRAPA